MSPSNIWNERSSAQQIFAKHRPFKIIASSLRIMCNVLFWKYLFTTTPSSSPRSAPSRLSFHSFLSHQVQIVLSTVLDVWPSAGKWSTHQGLFKKKKKKRQDITWHDMAWAGCMRMVMQGSEVSCHLQKLAWRCNRKKMGCDPEEDKQGSGTRNQWECDGSESWKFSMMTAQNIGQRDQWRLEQERLEQQGAWVNSGRWFQVFDILMKDPPTQAVGGVTGVKAAESQQTRSNLLKTLLLSGLQVPLPSLRLLRLLQSRLKIRHQFSVSTAPQQQG